MEIIGLGTEIVECVRIAALLERHADQFLTKVYTSAEALACRQSKKSTELFATCWAGKEAVMKCLTSGKRRRLQWPDIEITLAANAQPKVTLYDDAAERAANLRVTAVLLSVSSCRAYATATAIAVR